MQNCFKWNGVSCLEYGIVVTEQPTITIAKERVEEVQVPGRSGILHLPEGTDVYDSVSMTLTCYIRNPAKIWEIAAWLKGEGKIEFANREGGYYYGRLSSEIAFNKIMRGRQQMTFELEFVCKPFWYSLPVETVTYTSQGSLLAGEGTVYAEPIITLVATGDMTLMVNDTTVYLTDLAGNITLDCAAGIAYSEDDGELSWAGDKVTLENGEWPTLKGIGQNNLFNWTLETGATLTSLSVTPNWRYL